ncbi:DUF3300 domain-containing protein [Paraburkholderia dinghuensis]|uniref:DUF3300 domain-containing protein n=1 Tax=Paraburkholderia dinghuensis TaxID=2305225 RepID=A0A3N6NAV2_9BURK|nr:DUF3300 domain-containing protein [Paraburkholderia dinghuensis]RQH05457.1 DUF3300 domain-containing protein [Paraburkholderia dinghuensis]
MSNWKERWVRGALLWLILLVAAPAFAQAGTEGPSPYKPEEIEALVAPIALYPDSVLAQVLMAATYPLEIVHAARWVKAHPDVKGDAAVQAVQDQSWDASVKSMVAFPQILEPMYDKLDWTQKLGDAFLAQQQDVFAAVQRLRSRAQEAGNLKSNEQQQVITEPAAAGGTSIVRIEPTNPQVIYVPAYDPAVVYGSWGYPAYPPYYWPPYPAYYPGYYPGAALATGFAWGIGLAAAGAIFSDCNSCWGGGDININSDRARNVDRNFDSSKLKNGERGGRWQHDAGHRQGVAYRDNATRDKFAGSSGADRRSQYRGRGAEGGNRVATADRGGAGNRASVADRSAGGAGNRGSAGGVNRVNNGNRASYGGGGYSGGRDGAFSGVGGGGGASQRNFDRGSRSMQGSGFSRPSGGGMRGGGGGRGGRR